MLHRKFSEFLTEHGEGFVTTGSFIPDCENRDFWESVASIESAAKLRARWETEPVEHLTASLYMLYEREGNRTRYAAPYFKRRMNLRDRVIACCIDPKDEERSSIEDLVWMICEESTWCVPAHNRIRGLQSPALCDADDPFIGLFAAETAALLFWTRELLPWVRDSYDGLIDRRISRELRIRIIDPYLNRIDMFWMGLDPAQAVNINNWNPWIMSNILPILLGHEDFDDVKIIALDKGCKIIDKFIDSYAGDGVCDEGTSYWSRAAASLFECLELIYLSSKGTGAVGSD